MALKSCNILKSPGGFQSKHAGRQANSGHSVRAIPCRGLLLFIHIEYWMMGVSCQPKVQILLFASFLGFVVGLGFGIFRDLGFDLGLSTDISLRYSLPSSVFHCWQRAGLGASVVLLIHGSP